ncbi:MAG: hypothetical protein P8K10_03440 [Crocinitomicaceae bacterium]|nr:hypothetical protein [Crocinitomicaceae bacterium]
METLLVEKETIPSLPFNDKSRVKQHPNLRKQIDKATILGNMHRRKVSIVFEDDNGIKRVDTTIWASGTKFVCLKGGVWIPINRLKEILV